MDDEIATLAEKASMEVELNIETTVAGYLFLVQALQDFGDENPLYGPHVDDLVEHIENESPAIEPEIREVTPKMNVLYSNVGLAPPVVQEGTDDA